MLEVQSPHEVAKESPQPFYDEKLESAPNCLDTDGIKNTVRINEVVFIRLLIAMNIFVCIDHY